MPVASPLFDYIRVSQFGGELSSTSSEVVLHGDLYAAAKEQAVMGMVAPLVPAEAQKADGRWREFLYRQVANYARYMHAQDALCALMNGAGIPFVILKGSAAATYYRNPSERTMGDIDFQVLPDDFERTRTLLLEGGYVLDSTSEEHERHIAFDKDGVHFELHRKFSHEEMDLEDYIVPGISAFETKEIDGHAFPMLPKLPNGLVLLDHMKSHLRAGLGLRQVVDWMMYVHAELDDRFWNDEFGAVAKSKGLDTLAKVTTRACQIYLGLNQSISWCREANEETCRMLMDNLLTSGNFGRKQGSGNTVEAVTTAFRREGVFRRLQRAGEYNWKAYKKHHWLKPFCWFYQIFRYIKQGLKSGRSRKQIKGDLERSKERYELLKRLGIS